MGKTINLGPGQDAREPALTRAGITGAAAVAIMWVCDRLGLDVTAVAYTAAAVGPVVTGLLVRFGVFSPATVASMQAVREPVG